MWHRKPEASIRIDGDAFTLVGGESEPPPIALDDIEQVTFFKRDELTTDLICCEIAAGGTTWFLHEEVSGWNDLMTFLERLPGFKRDWFDAVAKPAFAENRTVVFQKSR